MANRLIFGEFLPDQPAHLNQGLVTADGCYAIANGYAPLRQFSPSSNGILASTAIGGASYSVDATTYIFGATASNIYKYSSGGWTSVQATLSGTQAIGVKFAPYNNLMIATNGVDPIKKFDPASPSAMTNLGGTPPTARFIAVVRGFLVLGYAANDALRVVWSDNGSPTTWTAGTGEAGFYVMSTGGDITGVVGGEYGLIFQKNRIVRMSYTADDTIWQFDEIAADIGCIAPNSIAVYGKLVFFLSNKGMMMCDGVNVTPIGNEKIDRTYLASANPSYFGAMSAVVDPRNLLYIVTLPSSSPTTTAYIYNYALQRWTTASLSTDLLFSALSQSVTLEDLDALYGTLEAVPVSLDDPSFRGGYPILLMFDSSHRLGSLGGSPMAATFTDAKREMVQGMRTRLRSVRLLTDAPVATVSVAGSNTLNESATSTSYTVRSRSGEYKTRENWDFMQVTVSIPAGTAWSYVQGMDADATGGGRP